jgi:hypothetical protein
VRKIENLIFVSTGGYTPTARAFRRQAMVETGRNILLLDQDDVDAICTNEGRLEDIIRRENAYCRAVRSDDAGYWLPLQMQWLMPDAIRDLSLTDAEGEKAWQTFREMEQTISSSLKGLFLRVYHERYAELQRGEPFQLTFGL